MNKYTLIYNQYIEEEGDMPGRGSYQQRIARIKCDNLNKFLEDNPRYVDLLYAIDGHPLVMKLDDFVSLDQKHTRIFYPV